MTSRASRVLRSVAMLGMIALATVAVAQEEEETLHELAARGDVPRLARAIEAGQPVDGRDDDGRTALHVAAKEAHLFAAMMLIAKGADPNVRDRAQKTPLHLAADGEPDSESERFQIVKLLVASGADLRARDASGKRAVDYARDVELKNVLATPPDSKPKKVTSPPASPPRRHGSP